jgi:hypothetical protein
VWRIVLAGLATLREVEHDWSLIDVLEANEILDMKEELEELVRRDQKRG